MSIIRGHFRTKYCLLNGNDIIYNIYGICAPRAYAPRLEINMEGTNLVRTDKKETKKDKRRSTRADAAGSDTTARSRKRTNIKGGRNASEESVKKTDSVAGEKRNVRASDKEGGKRRGGKGLTRYSGAEKLKIIFLGGVGEIGKNMTALEYGDTIIVVDAGMAFPDNEITPGIDSIIPDYAYLEENRSKVKAVMLTHAHEDHLGGLPYFLKDFPVPVYGSNVSCAFLEHKLRRNKFKEANCKVVEDGEIAEIGPFKVEFVAVTHSVAGSLALSIETPKGVVFFTGDFKIDHTPVDGRHIALTRIAEIGKRGVKLLLQDSTNVERRGYSMSESAVGKSLDAVFNDNRMNRIIVATFASNIHRVQQIIDVAIKYGRKIALSGKSMQYMTEIAQKIKELRFPQDKVIDFDKVSGVPYDKVCIIATGTQGEPESALTRMSQDDFKKIVIGENDTVILSASPIPGNERSIYKVINNLSKKGAKVIYESLYEVHSSGHACQEELKMMMALIKPEYFMPVHGEYRHLKKHAELAETMGIPRDHIMIPELGYVVEVGEAGLKRLDKVNSGAVMLVGDTEEVEETLIDRRKLASEGIVIALVNVPDDEDTEGSIDILCKGTQIPEKLLAEIKSAVQYKIAGGDFRELTAEDMDKSVRKTMTKMFYNRLKRCPLIVPIIITS